MKIFIIDCYYSKFLDYHYSTVDYKELSFHENQQKLFDQLFSSSNFLSMAFRKHGVESIEVVSNDNISQLKWYNENLSKKNGYSPYNSILNKIYIKFKLDFLIPDYRILENQIKKYNPDIIYIQEGNILSDNFIGHIRKYGKVVGQVASAFPADRTYKNYDLLISALPYFVDYFNENGKKCHFVRLSFCAQILNKIKNSSKNIPISFVGTNSPEIYKYGTNCFEYLAERENVKFWGMGYNNLDENSSLRKNWQGHAWGIDSYQIMNQSKITLNRHGEIAKNYATNVRLYEATGVGTCLVTDWKENLNTIFELDKEIVAYKSKEELVEKVKYLLSHNDERETIAFAGQKRTLTDHTYENRASELLEIFKINLM